MRGRGHLGTVGGLALLDQVGGRYFEDYAEAAVVRVSGRGGPGSGGVAGYALDPANAERLWDTALALLPLAASR